MKTQISACRLKTAAKSNVFIRRWAGCLRSLYRKYRRGVRTHPGIPGRIHYNDDSYFNSSPSHYLSVGQSALENIEQALVLTGKSLKDIETCLDFPCGYGRITRVLQTQLPGSARIDACDILPEAVNFCAQEFGANPVLSQEDISKVNFPRTYDLVWIGSLLTHLDRKSFIDTLKLAAGSLEEEGILIFTTHGSYSLEILDSYGIQNMDREDVERSLRESGFHFSPYPGDRAYGISINTEGFVRSLLEQYFPNELKLLFYKPRGWDSHQDVFACRKMKPVRG